MGGNKNFQTINYPLPSLSWVAGGRTVIRGRDLPATVFGRIAHLKAIHFEFDLDPTYTAVPTVVGHNNVINRLEFFDGQQVRFTGSLNALRMFERLENGGNRVMEAVTGNASTNNRYWSRMLYMGPPGFAGSPSDFVYPCAALENAEIRVNWGALTDISSDTTAATCSVRVTAVLVLLDEVRIPPFYERTETTLAGADTPITGRALYAYIGLCNSSTYDAFAAGDIATVTVDTGQGQLVPATDARALSKLYNQEHGRGSLDGLAGDPNNATYDVNDRIVNLGTPTALAAQAFDLQPVVWCPPGTRITKVAGAVESSLRLRWSGANGSGTMALVGRILAQPPTAVAAIAERARRVLGAQGGNIKVKTLSKDSYNGPAVEFMPYSYKLV